MLIKNNKGDWGIVTAYWEGFAKTVKGNAFDHVLRSLIQLSHTM